MSTLEPVSEQPPSHTFRFARSAPWTIFSVLIATMLSFGGAMLYSHHIASKIDADGASIANNASPSIEYLAAARGEVLELQLAATTAIQRVQDGAPLDRAPFDTAISRLHDQLSAYLQLPFFPQEHELYAGVAEATRSLEAQVAKVLDRLAAKDIPGAVAALRLGLSTAAARADEALEQMVTFNAVQQHRLGTEIPVLRSHAARVGSTLEAVSALFAMVLMGLVLRAARQHARFLELEQRSTEARAKDLAAFSSRLESMVTSSVAISSTISQSSDARRVFQTIAEEARTLVGADFCALGCGTDPSRRFDPWVYSGFSAAEVDAIGETAPRPVGVLGAVVREGHSIRTDDVTKHAAFERLPEQHPALGPFVGVPILHEGRNVGNLYLARKANRAPFSEDDARVVEMLAAYAGVAIENARLYMQAQSATHAREDLLATVSHDLRNPLSAIGLAVGLLRRKIPENATELLGRIDRAAARMSRLITDLLDAAKIEAGLLQTAPQPESVASLVEEAVEGFRLVAAEKSLKLVSHTPSPSVMALCERDRIQRVFSNLIGNAVKFTPAGGTISVAAEALTEEVQISVTDTGPGIPTELLAHIFDRYWQQKSGEHRGSGLGLYIAKGIVEAHGGRIWVESRPGSGTTIRFTLPQR